MNRLKKLRDELVEQQGDLVSDLEISDFGKKYAEVDLLAARQRGLLIGFDVASAEYEKILSELEDFLIEHNEFTASFLEDIEHYHDNKCCPTSNEVNQVATADSMLRLVIVKLKEFRGSE